MIISPTAYIKRHINEISFVYSDDHFEIIRDAYSQVSEIRDRVKRCGLGSYASKYKDKVETILVLKALEKTFENNEQITLREKHDILMRLYKWRGK